MNVDGAEGSEIPRRSVLRALGATTTLSVPLSKTAAGSLLVGTSSLGTQSSATRSDPSLFGGANDLRPHIVAWGGNNLLNRRNGFEETSADRRKDSILSMHSEGFWPRGIGAFEGPPRDTFGLTVTTRGQFEFALDHGFTPIQTSRKTIDRALERRGL